MKLELMYRVLLFAWWFSNFTPLTDFINKKIKPLISNKLSYLKDALTCWKCLSFWITLGSGFIFCNEFLWAEAILAAVIAYSYDRIMNSFRIHL
jgi:hypothetical protein